jgi:hypothetical protein
MTKLSVKVASWALLVILSSSVSAVVNSWPMSRPVTWLSDSTSDQDPLDCHICPIPGRCEPCPGNTIANGTGGEVNVASSLGRSGRTTEGVGNDDRCDPTH